MNPLDDDANKIMAAAATAGVIGLLMGIGRGIVQQRHNGWGGFIRGLVASIIVAILVGWGLVDFDLSPTTQAVIIGICSYLADDVLLGLQEVAKLFGADPLGTVQRVWGAIRGAPKDKP